MKKTFTINISGSVFHIEEDAYEKLREYLHMLSLHFGSEADGREILQDIEARIAELFEKKMEAEGKDVILDSWVDEVICRMGKPEDFTEGEAAEEEKNEEPAASSGYRVKRRMYRDPDHRVLGGVCSGMGAYFNIDPVVLRIIFFILFWISAGIALLVYLMLWIAVPKAKTTAEKLEMRGQEATVSNIEKSIKDEVREVKESYRRFRNSECYEKGRERMGRAGDIGYNVLKVVLKVIVILAGIFLILGGFVGLIGFILSLSVGHSFLEAIPWLGNIHPDFQVPYLAHFFIPSGSLSVMMIALGFLVGIPLLGILFAGTKMVFRYKSNNRMIFFSALVVWLAALITFSVVTLSQIRNYSQRTTISKSQLVDCPDCKTLYLKLGNDPYANSDVDPKARLERMKVVFHEGEPLLLGSPRLDVEKSNTDDFVILIRKKARGGSLENARENAENISYIFTRNDSVILFNPYFLVEHRMRWLDQGVDIIVKVPEGKAVYLGEKMEEIIYDIENVSNTWDGDMVGKYWKMTPLGLEEKMKKGSLQPN
ncbi:MAG: PspC domain-containing protein [Mangrovibacterium sp.]